VYEVVAALEAGAGLPGPVGPPRMTAAQVAELHRRGVEIGCHTIGHSDLTRLSTRQVEAELRESRTWLEGVCGARVRGFAFPAGRCSERTLEIVRREGFDYSVLTAGHVNDPAGSLYRLGRIGMPDTSVLDFKRALAFLPRHRQAAERPADAVAARGARA
jgi:peptidoglycan/xylan/chitin deacetylase (PgdA/CDA1 family)